MNITTNRLTIAQLFATLNEQFVVPSYQRRYAWGYNQYTALFEDIDMLKEDDGHLFGMIILHTDYHTAGINRPELVDGQQRMTTLVVLLKAFEHAYRHKGSEDKASEIRKMVNCKGLDEVIIPKIQLGELDNKDMHDLIIFDKSDEMSNKYIKSAYDEYRTRLFSLDVKDLNIFYYKLTNIAVVIRLDVGMAKDAYKLFETINNRGLRLTPTDIIKNFLLGHAAKINEEKTLERVKGLWSRIITNLDEIDTDDFLRQFMCSTINRKLPVSKLVLEFKKYYLKNIEKAELLGEYEYYQESPMMNGDEDDELELDVMGENGNSAQEEMEAEAKKITIIEFLQRLESISLNYRKISKAEHENRKINRSIHNLNRILSKSSYIFLMHFLINDKYAINEKISILKLIETLMLRRHICEKRTSENDDIFAKMVQFIGKDDILNAIKKFIQDEEYIPNDMEFEDSFPKHQFKGILVDRAKYVLESVEYYLRGNTDELLVSSGSEVHLEHIIPQTISTKKSKDEFGDWLTYLGDKSEIKHKKYAHYIGNMTLLGEALNIKASNNPFAKKKKSYRKSSLLITKKLAKNSDFKFYHVDKRSEELTRLALEIWKI